MSKLLLPTITLVLVETREHTLARMAIEECLDKAEFGDILILTDRPLEFSSLTKSHNVKPRIHTVENWPEKMGWSRSWWFDVPPLLQTKHTLNIQWDSWIWDAEQWTDEFLNYDYIGAPWWYKDGKNVGNGGFSLVSSRLKRYIYANRATYPCDTSVDDDLLCRKYRLLLEQKGFVWAPEKLAHRFAFECCRPSPTSKHFGFHSAQNFPVVLDAEALQARLDIMLKSEYIRDSYMLRALMQQHPHLALQAKQADVQQAMAAARAG